MPKQALGIRVPPGLSADSIAAAVGRNANVPTINVETQRSGPRMTLGAWAAYFGAPAPQRQPPLLNVVSLQLAGTPLQARQQPHAGRNCPGAGRVCCACVCQLTLMLHETTAD